MHAVRTSGGGSVAGSLVCTNSVRLQVQVKHSALMELKRLLEASQADIEELESAAQVRTPP